jgi:hypothetical protein
MFASIFSVKCPWLHVLRWSMFCPATMNALLLTCDMWGNMMLTALFFSSSGGATDEAESDPMCEPGDIWMMMGQILMVGMVSAVISMIPGMIFGAMHAREFIKFKREDGRAWQKTLRKWRVQDRAIWAVGVAYCLFAVFFTVLFLANTTQMDGMEWAIAVAISTIQTSVAVPFVVSFFTVLAVLGTSCHPHVREQTSRHFIQHPEQIEKIEQKRALQNQEGDEGDGGGDAGDAARKSRRDSKAGDSKELLITTESPETNACGCGPGHFCV